MTREFGDFQTPLELTRQVLWVLSQQGKRWSRVLEPTCGIGNFITSLLDNPDIDIDEIQAIEIQQDHLIQAQTTTKHASKPINFLHKNIFDVQLSHDLHWNSQGDLLVLGNPP